LHFTEALLAEIRARGVEIIFVTLHVGLGTFAPVKADSLAEHVMHEERFEVSEASANAVNLALQNDGQLTAGTGRTRIFIFPPRNFQIVDGMLTNFHLPRSTLLMLVSAFAAPGKIEGREFVLSAYAEAVRERYRFFSYGDAMLIV
jgi:S-adenosylmethionine:tRNA ribosyltransferase-isomerase